MGKMNIAVMMVAIFSMVSVLMTLPSYHFADVRKMLIHNQ